MGATLVLPVPLTSAVLVTVGVATVPSSVLVSETDPDPVVLVDTPMMVSPLWARVVLMSPVVVEAAEVMVAE